MLTFLTKIGLLRLGLKHLNHTACAITFMGLHVTGIDDKIENPHSVFVYIVFCVQQHEANLIEME